MNHKEYVRSIALGKLQHKRDCPDCQPSVVFVREGDYIYCYGYDAMIVAGLNELTLDVAEIEEGRKMYIVAVHIGIANLIAASVVAANRSVSFIGNFPELTGELRIEDGRLIEREDSYHAN